MKKHILISIIFAVILLSLSGCMGLHHMSHTSHGAVNHETADYMPANHATSNLLVVVTK